MSTITTFPLTTRDAQAALVENVPHGRVTATDVQTAINQLADQPGPTGAAGPIGPPGPQGITGGTGGAAGGATTNVQFNDTTSLAGEANFVYEKINNIVTISGDSSGFAVASNRPQVGGDANRRRAVDISVNTDSSTSNPTFSNEEAVGITMVATNGQSTNDGGTNAKRTFLPLNVGATYNASGQKFIYGQSLTAYGMGDSAIWGNKAHHYAGGPVSGDEGQGWGLVSDLVQQDFLSVTTISSIPTQSTYNTTTTQIITASKDSQVVTVTSTAGAVVNDWIIVDQQVHSGTPTLEAVQIEAIGAGTITGKFLYNHASGATIKPALVLVLNSTFQMGQDRMLVNLSQPAYTTGTVSSISGGGFVGTGTAWATNVVGGNALNIGCITLTNDDFTASPFDTGANRLRTWYPVTSVTDATHLAIHTFSTAADLAYRGNGVGAGGYTIRPSAKILRIEAVNGSVTGTLILENSTSTWTVGDSVECVICPWPDVTGYQYHMRSYTPGGTYRHFMRIKNNGGRTFSTCFNIVADGPVGAGTGAGGADLVAWNIGIQMSSCGTGVDITAKDAGVRLRTFSGSGTPDAGGQIQWDSGTLWIKPESTTLGGLQIAGTFGGIGEQGLLNFVFPTVVSGIPAHATLASMHWNGLLAQKVTGGGVRPLHHLYNANGPTDFERGFFRWTTNVFEIGTEKGGAGADRTLALCPGGATKWSINPGATTGGDFIAGVDNTYDIGLDATFRPRDVNVARDVKAAQDVKGGRIVKTGSTVVASLISAATAGAGARMFVTDATVTTFNSTVAGGGANKVPVVSDGTNWLIG